MDWWPGEEMLLVFWNVYFGYAKIIKTKYSLFPSCVLIQRLSWKEETKYRQTWIPKLKLWRPKRQDTDLLMEEIGKLEDKVECADNALKADWERWKQSMQNDTKSAFTKIWLRRTSSVVNRVLLHGNPSLHHRQISTWKKPLKINCNLTEDLYVIFGR